MPELPEVETTCRGIAPHISGKPVTSVVIRNNKLRWPVSEFLPNILKGQILQSVTRRAKYCLLTFNTGTLLVHLGMSGSMRILNKTSPVGKHDHIDLVFGDNTILRYNDPRRFGSFVWHEGNGVEEHSLLAHLGPEPLSDEFDAQYLCQRAQTRKQPIKSFIMDAQVVVGVGNIYANEALFAAGIHPLKTANKLSLPKAALLTHQIKTILAHAISRGGTTLRDFVGGDGKPGYFAQELNVYGRGGKPCKRCAKLLTEKRLQNRTTIYCTACQK